jgi:hypothetical protein
MGMQSQQPNQSQVYYDTEQGQYYTVKPPENYGALFPLMRIYGNNTDKYMQDPANRNYLGNPYSSENLDRFIPKTITPQYPEMNMLFPGLNAGLLQGIASSAQPDGAMYGAGRFLSPQTNNTAPQTTNTEGK